VVCTNAAGTAVSCNPPSGQEPENYYVITYGGWESDGRNGYKRPNWWPREGSRMRRFESWRKAMKNRTRGSITCGVLTQIGNNWCIDNGETVYKNEAAPNLCMNPVPEAVIGALGYNDNAGKDDLLFCYSEFKQGVRPGHYAKTARYFYDGLSNAGIGQHQSGKDVRSWTNLVDNNPETNNLTWNSITSGANPQNGKWEGSTPYLLLDGYLNTKIKLGESYTLTILLSSFWRDTVNDSVEAIPCGLLQTSDQDNSVTNVTTIFAKISEQLEGTDAVLLNINGETIAEKRASICNMDSRGNNASIVSWTFVVRKEGEVYKLDVYENAKRRFRDEPIEDIKDKYLLLGNSERGQVPHIYGIRYYDSVLTDAQIQKNFKVDQKRFGISDINNGNIGDRCINEGAVKQGGAE
ncbi:MAG: hypothetical protein ACI4OR_03725, partial [Alphaproteobacteria bacterium]